MFLLPRPRRELASVLAPTTRRAPLREMAPPRSRRRDQPRASGERRSAATMRRDVPAEVFFGQGVYSVLCTLERAAGVRQAPAGRKWGRLVASERQPKQPSSCPDTPPTHDVPLLPVWPLTAGPRARLRRNLVTAVVTPVHRCDGCLSDRDKQASLRIASPPVASADAQLAESSLPSADRLRERAGAF